EAGEIAAMYAQGEATSDLTKRPKTGAARIWLATNAPVIPVTQWRERKSIWRRIHVTVSVGQPIDLSHWNKGQGGTLAREPEEVRRRLLAELSEALMPPLRKGLAAPRHEPVPRS